MRKALQKLKSMSDIKSNLIIFNMLDRLHSFLYRERDRDYVAPVALYQCQEHYALYIERLQVQKGIGRADKV